MSTLLTDLKYSTRTLLKSPSFTLIAVLTLALGIGATTAFFSVVYSVLLRPLPYPEPHRIMQLVWDQDGFYGALDDPQFRFFQRHSQSLENLSAYTSVGFNITGSGKAERADGLRVSAGYFEVLGISPARGRTFLPEDDVNGAPAVAVVSDGFWKRRFGASPAILDQTILLDGKPHTIIGVMPAGFHPEADPEIWSTLAPVVHTVGSGRNYNVFGRLKSGVTPQQADSDIAARLEEFRKEFPRGGSSQVPLKAHPYQKLLTTDIETPLLVLFGAIGFVLLIACANVANLLLARSSTRAREVAVRTAIGASRSRIIRQLLTESLLLSLFGAALGILVGRWGLDLLLALTPENTLPLVEVRLDSWVLAFTIAVSLLSGILFGLAPALQISRANLHDALKEGAARASAGRSRIFLRNALAVGEVALSLILLAGSALLIRTFVNLLHTDAGFNPSRILSTQIWITGSRYHTSAELAGYYNALVERIQSLPGVESAAVSGAGAPLERGGNVAASLADTAASELFSTDLRVVTPDYFHTLGVSLRQGRLLNAQDTSGSAPVIVVNESFARRYLRGQDPIGKRIRSAQVVREIVGVVSDVRSNVQYAAPPTLFFPAPQAPYSTSVIFDQWFPTTVLVRSAANPAQLRNAVEAAVRETDAEIPVGEIRTMEGILSTSVAYQRFLMSLLSIFAGLALMLALIGIYGVISYSVSQRVPEFGIRMALGAQRAGILRLVLRQGLLLAGIGVALGIAGALALTRFLESMLYRVPPRDPLSLALAAVALLAVAALACYIPARRATRTDPLSALRYE